MIKGELRLPFFFMKKFLMLFLLMIPFQLNANIDSERDDIKVFDVLDFRYPPNYEDYNDGTITTKFLEELNTDEKKLRYYWICYTSLHFNKKLMTDKNFRKDLQKHFHGKSLTHEQENIIFRSMASLILSDPVDELRTALIETSRENLDFFNKLLKRIDHVKLK